MGKIISDYLEKSIVILRKIAEEEEENIEAAAGLIADAYARGRNIYIFGCTHSAILAEDVFYRAGAPAFWRPLWGPGMSITTTPGFLTSAAEHSEELGTAVIECSKLSKNDVIVIASTSGKNGAPVAVADTALKRGAKLILITSKAYHDQVGNHSKIANLWAFRSKAVIIDNHVPKGDASIQAGQCRMGPLSTIAGSFIMQTVSALSVEKLVAMGIEPPVFLSSNVPGGREQNEKLLNLPGIRDSFMLP